MVYIDKKYPSQQGSIKRGAGEAFSLASQIAMIAQVVCFIILCATVDKNMGNGGMETVKYLWSNYYHSIVMVVEFLSFLCTYVFCTMAKKIRSSLIAPTYIMALNCVFAVPVIIMSLIYIF